MKKPAILLLLFLALSGCGGDPRAPLDASITGPEDGEFTVAPGGGGDHIVRAIDFQVKNSVGVAIPGVEIELFAGGGGILTDLDGNPLNSVDPTYFKTETDDRGVARASFLITLPDCDTEEVKVVGSVGASVGVASDVWLGSWTVQACS